jgi:hypothetical protein
MASPRIKHIGTVKVKVPQVVGQFENRPSSLCHSLMPYLEHGAEATQTTPRPHSPGEARW